MFTKILFGVDPSEHSRKALPLVTELARQFQAEVVVLHVHEHVMGRGGGYDVETDTEASVLTDHVVKELKDQGLSARGELRSAYFGHTAKRIVEVAKTEGADLIVLGSRGLSDIAGLVLGSVAHKVLQLSEVPVLIAR